MLEQNFVRIHFNRPGKPPSEFIDGLVQDDGRQLVTFTILPEQRSQRLTQEMLQPGFIHPGQRVHSIKKIYFYEEYFDILEFRDPQGALLGIYSDIVTPLRKVGDEYFLTDLVLDLWITSDGLLRELDLDEFAEASQNKLFSVQLQRAALRTFQRLKDEFAAGIYPHVYLS